MFEILALDKSRNTTVIVDGVLAVIRDGFGNPLALIQSLGANQTTIITADDPTFQTRLKQFGVDKTVIVDRYVAKTSGV